jgi:hypothetical protein
MKGVGEIKEHSECDQWASEGECTFNPAFMWTACQGASSYCNSQDDLSFRLLLLVINSKPNVYLQGSCVQQARDAHPECEEWAGTEECTNNPGGSHAQVAMYWSFYSAVDNITETVKISKPRCKANLLRIRSVSVPFELWPCSRMEPLDPSVHWYGCFFTVPSRVDDWGIPSYATQQINIIDRIIHGSSIIVIIDVSKCVGFIFCCRKHEASGEAVASNNTIITNLCCGTNPHSSTHNPGQILFSRRSR